MNYQNKKKLKKMAQTQYLKVHIIIINDEEIKKL